MLQSGFRGHPCQIRRSPATERSTGGCQDNALQFRRRPRVQALVDRVVLAVHRQHLDTASPRRLHHDPARHHEDFLVGERDRLAVFDRGEHR